MQDFLNNDELEHKSDAATDATPDTASAPNSDLDAAAAPAADAADASADAADAASVDAAAADAADTDGANAAESAATTDAAAASDEAVEASADAEGSAEAGNGSEDAASDADAADDEEVAVVRAGDDDYDTGIDAEIVEEVDLGTNSLLALAEGKDPMSLSEEDLLRYPQMQVNREGFRLQRVDIYNWSSFNNNVKSVYFGGQNVLMTGDNGAGKSSLIDAMTVLLYDVRKVTFNQAAGAEKGERNLNSYVLGLYKNDNSSGVKTEHGLRSKQSAVLSIISASFYNETLDEYVVLLQAMVHTKSKGTLNRYYFIGNQDFNLQHDILPVKDVKELGAKLRKLGTTRYDGFSEYYSQMQRLFGIEGTKVLDLFYKTISMKSISNISDFVRKQMLEDFNGDELVEEMVDRFNDLDASYRSVEEAKKQVEALEPICIKGEEYSTVNTQVDFLERCKLYASPYLFKKKSDLLTVEIEANKQRLDDINHDLERSRGDLERINTQIQNVQNEINQRGGNRQQLLEQSIAAERRERDRVYTAFEEHRTLMSNLSLPEVKTEKEFQTSLVKLNEMKQLNTSKIANYEDNIAQRNIELKTEQDKLAEVAEELDSLRNRKNNLPKKYIDTRNEIAQAIGCTDQDLPFAGELMQIRNEEKAKWEFAVEKLLRSFGLSMLVPEQYYRDVVNYVHSNNLAMRLVFYRISENDVGGSNNRINTSLGAALGGSFDRPRITATSLPRKIEIKNDPVFHGFIRNHLEKSFNYVCTEDQDEYRREKFALMPSGLFKAGGRNEKDDRRSRNGNDYILGWTNEDKIAILSQERMRIGQNIDTIEAQRRTLMQGMSLTGQQQNVIGRLAYITRFSEIDFGAHDKVLEGLYQELNELKSSSDIMLTLNKRKEELYEDKRNYEMRRDSWLKEQGSVSSRNGQLESQLRQSNDLCLNFHMIDEHLSGAIERLLSDALGRLHLSELTHDRIDVINNEVITRLQQDINSLQNKKSGLSQQIVALQSRFTQTFEVAARNLDASRADAWEDFKIFFDKLQQDDLPRFVDAFKDKLNRETIDQLGTLNAALLAQSRKIKERIADINSIMKDVDFNPDHYIQMVATESADVEIKQFRLDLKTCTSPLPEEDKTLEAADERFHQVKALIDRFKCLVNEGDIDRRWRNKVTDVKMWYEFSASEHTRQDDSQVDYYEDSGGKSGGQKEKLAYTVLASSLAYQYQSNARNKGISFQPNASSGTVAATDLDAQNAAAAEESANTNQSHASYVDRSFRFVIIDEAFGRGSPQSVDYALTLFSKFNLQLLVATPMQKLDIIEKYVKHVAFVYRDEESHESTVVNYDLLDYILKRKLKEHMTRAPVLTEKAAARGDAIAKLSIDKAGELYDKLNERIINDQDKYSGPCVNPESAGAGRASLATAFDAAATAASEAATEAAQAAAAQAAAAAAASAEADAAEADADADASASASADGASAPSAATAAEESTESVDAADAKADDGDDEAELSDAQRDANQAERDQISEEKQLKDENGAYFSVEEFSRKVQEEHQRHTQQRTEEALSKLDFLMSDIVSSDEDTVTEADDQSSADGADESSESDNEFILTPQTETKPKGRGKKKDEDEDEEPQYEVSLEDLLVVDEDEEDIY